MRVKLDENFGRRAVEVSTAANIDVDTIIDEGLAGISDDRVVEVCKDEGRVLVTLDLDFANPLRFPPSGTPGVAVVRVSHRPGRSELLRAAITLCAALGRDNITGKLWVCRRGPRSRVPLRHSRADWRRWFALYYDI